MTADRPLRITCVEPNDRGGLQHFAFQLCEALAGAGNEVTLVTSTGSELEDVERSFRLEPVMRLWPIIDASASAAATGPRRLLAKARRGLRAALLVREWIHLCRRLDRERPDVVQFGAIRFPFEAVFLRHLRRRGLVLTQICHEFERRDQGPRWLAGLNRRLSRPLLRSFDVIFVLSDDVRRRLLDAAAIDPSVVRQIPHGDESLLLRGPVDAGAARRRYGLAADDRLALFFGRVRRTKGVDDLLDAWPKVVADVPDARLAVVGSPTDLADGARLRRRVTSEGLAPSTVLDLRYVELDEVPSLLAAADVVVLPYRDATQSGVLHLAATAGRPVVATAIGGLAEDVVDGETGLLVEPGDTDGLAAAVARLLADRDLATSMGARARATEARDHSWAAVADRVDATYRELEGGRSEPGGPRLRVRTGRDYPVSFMVDVGQRNASIVRGPQAPLKRLAPWGDAVGIVPGRWDLIHTLNAVPVATRTPFVVSFEDYLPRCPEDRRGGHWLNGPLRERLLSPRCIRILAMSEYGLGLFTRQQAGWPGLDAALAKTELLRPSIELRRERPKQANEALRVCFVGKDFMHKGAPALVRAHARLRRAGIPIETTVVSALRWDPNEYVGPPSQARYDEAVRELRTTDGVVHRGTLSNEEVLRIMDESDYLVMPTLHDTFGFVTLEAMAGATPVIATATCALPEVVEHGVSGYLVPLDVDDTGRWAHLYRSASPGYLDAYDATMEALASSLEEQLARCWEERSAYEALSAGAIERVRSHFDRSRARSRLEAIYDESRHG